MARGTPGARVLRRLFAVALVAAAAAIFTAGTAWAGPPKALIDGSTVSGGLSSEEAYFATQAGYAVTVVDDSTWASMSQSDFAQYNLLIAGDPFCSTLPPGLVASAPVWGPVVLGEAGGRTFAGNRVVVGTDPVLHSGGNTGSVRSIVIKDGIAYAGSQPDTTGMYLDTTCAANYYGQSAETLTVLNAITTSPGSWTLDAGPPCGGNVSLIASNPAFSDLTTADLEGWGCSVHESFPTFPTDFSALAVATDTASHPTCGEDPSNGNASACGEAYVLVAGSGIVVKSGSISLDPTDATNPVGTDHTVTATVTSGGSPLSGQTVTFTVTGINAGASGTCVPAGCVTDANGNVSFTYHDANGAGDDTIKASFTDARGSLQSATAQKHWVGVVEQPITATGTTISATEGGSFSGAVATFSDPDAAATASEYTATIDWGDGSTSTGTISGSGGSFVVSGDHTYADEGSNAVTVTIADADTPTNGATATSSANVSDAALSAGSLSLSGATEGAGATNASFTFTDANTSAPASDFAATITWGDGVTSTGTVSGSGGSYTVSGSHAYADEGSYPVSVSVTDDGGSTAGGNGTALVSDASLTAGSLSLSGATEGAGATNASFTFTDANTSAPASDFAATITWGDGVTSTGTVSGSGGSYTVSGSHAYADEGSYPVSVSVTDDGGSTAGGNGTALVADAALHATGSSASTGQSYSGTVASFTDAFTGSTAADFTATINWGDSSSSTGTVAGSGGSYTVSGSHTYSGTGYYTVTVHVLDDGGSTATATSTLLIYAGAPGGGSFVIGNQEAAAGTAVTFWGAQWWKLNPMSGGSGPASFKGFENSGAAVCGAGWTARTGNSTPPPAGPLPAYMAVIVASTASQSGSTISGNAVHVVIVRTNAGYGPDPGHAGTGTVVATIC